MYKVGGLFSGIGGIEKGFENTGQFKVLWANEIDKYACETYRLNHSHKLYEEDLNLIKAKDLEPVNILTGGFPCQAFSIAGNRKGFDDERGVLFHQIMRLVDEFDSMGNKPEVLFLENVKNIKSHDKGNTFKIIEEHIRDRGYSFIWSVINTSDVTEIPQNRERTFMVCFKDEANWGTLFKKDPTEKYASAYFQSNFPPKKIEKTSNIQDMLEEGKVDDKYYYTKESCYFYEELLKTVQSRDTAYQWRRVYVRENKSNVCPTLTANMGTGGHNVPIIKDDYGFRKLTPKECFRLQGFDDIVLPNKMGASRLFKQAGNSVTVSVIQLLAELVYESLEYKYSENSVLVD